MCRPCSMQRSVCEQNGKFKVSTVVMRYAVTSSRCKCTHSVYSKYKQSQFYNCIKKNTHTLTHTRLFLCPVSNFVQLAYLFSLLSRAIRSVISPIFTHTLLLEFTDSHETLKLQKKTKQNENKKDFIELIFCFYNFPDDDENGYCKQLYLLRSLLASVNNCCCRSAF